MVLDLEQELKDNRTILISIPKRSYKKRLSSIMKDLSVNGRTFFINIDTAHSSLIQTFDKEKIPQKRVFFMNNAPQEKTSGILVLTRISIAVSKATRIQRFDYVLVDSLSDILSSEDRLIIIKLIHLIVSKLRLYEKKGIFLCRMEGLDMDMVKELNLIFDKIIMEK